MNIGDRKIGQQYAPLVVAEIGINHEGSYEKAIRMIDDAATAGCECVKFQEHIIEDEMIPNNVIPSNAEDTIWNIMKRCSLTYEESISIKKYTESKGMIFLSTPFSRAAADRLQKMGVLAFKIGSGECNNYPLVRHIASFGKPVVLSTGMNNLESISKSVSILRSAKIQFAIMHCTSIYPTLESQIRLNILSVLRSKFPDAVIGLSDHSMTIYPCLGAVVLGASILERHYTSDKTWPGPDISLSMDPKELKDLIIGSRLIHNAMSGYLELVPEEMKTSEFAYASVVSIKEIKTGEKLTNKNIWVKRPGTGYYSAKDYENLIGKEATVDIQKDFQISKEHIS